MLAARLVARRAGHKVARVGLIAALAALAACGGADPDPRTSSGAERHELRRQALAVRSPDPGALFDWAELMYPQYFPSHRSNQTFAPYIYRHYPETGNYVGVDGDAVVVLGPLSGNTITRVGTLADFGCRIYPLDCGWPALSVQPRDAGAIAGMTARFAVQVVGSAEAVTYQWQVSGDGGHSFTDIAGAVSATLSVPVGSAAASGRRFRVIVGNSLGSTVSRQAVLTAAGGGPRGSLTVSGDAAGFSRGVFVPAAASPFNRVMETGPVCVSRNGVTSCASTLGVIATESGANGSPLSMEQVSVSVVSAAAPPGARPGESARGIAVKYFGTDGRRDVEGTYEVDCGIEVACANPSSIGVSVDPDARVIIFRNVRLTLEGTSRTTTLDGVMSY